MGRAEAAEGITGARFSLVPLELSCLPSALVVGPDPSVSSVFAQQAGLGVFRSGYVDNVGIERVAFSFYVDAVDLGGVQSEDLGLVFFRDLRITKLLAHLVGDLEPLEGVD